MNCADCPHLRKPGRVEEGYCSARDDLPPTYGINHPLRKLPADRGAACTKHQQGNQ